LPASPVRMENATGVAAGRVGWWRDDISA